MNSIQILIQDYLSRGIKGEARGGSWDVSIWTSANMREATAVVFAAFTLRIVLSTVR